MPNLVRQTIFVLFIISGFCGLLYQVVWIRLAYASFGIITPVISVVISVFMLGLLIGSATGGGIAKKLTARFGVSALLLYALTEVGIGIGAFCVPRLFLAEQGWLLTVGGMDSFRYLVISGLAITVALLPWCVLMGFTYPFMMTFVRERDARASTTFSFLYLGNVIGAMAGTLVTALVLIELFGFTNTLMIAAFLNVAIAAVSFTLGSKRPAASADDAPAPMEPAQRPGAVSTGRGAMPFLLFVSGFAVMAMEIIWTRNFTPALHTVVYSYASLLTVYLFASWSGSYLYRRHLARSRCFSVESVLGGVTVFSLVPLVVNDPRLPAQGALLVLVSIMPLCGALGYLTPQLIDTYSRGSPSAAGRAYAMNTLGCILGPLFASYLFLPVWGVKVSLALLSAMFLACFLVFSRTLLARRRGLMALLAFSFVLLFVGMLLSSTYEEVFHHTNPVSEIRRDYAATVTSTGSTKSDKQLLVNGIGMTNLTPITQFMAHLPLAYCEQAPSSALIVCFGMGTTFRSLASWGINVTAVELVPGVLQAFGYYWADADQVLASPATDMVVDDGRRYLMRTDKKFDVITIDPAPPIEAAGSSLLYSTGMYDLVKQRLKEGGVLQQWAPGGEREAIQAVARSLAVSFPHVRAFRSIEGWGFHFLASMKPFDQYTARQLVARMPRSAQEDLALWDPFDNLERYMDEMLSLEFPIDQLLAMDPGRIITDDRPYNEYYLVRRVSDNTLAENALKLVVFLKHVLW